MGWREELSEAIKTKAERKAEEEQRKRKRLQEALAVADDALAQALDGLRFANEQFQSKKQPSVLGDSGGAHTLTMGELRLAVQLTREDAVLRVTFNDGRPREFDFAKDRHLSPKDVEEYVGRRAIELARTAQKANPW